MRKTKIICTLGPSTDQEGVGYVILRSDTKEVNLIFTLREGGFLQCSLLLTSQE